MDKHVIDASSGKGRPVQMSAPEVTAYNATQALLDAKAKARAIAEAKRVQDAALREAASVAALDYVASKPDAPQAVKDYAAAKGR